MELYEALDQLSEIRARIAKVDTFRGYRSVTVGFTGLLAVLGAVIQSVCIPDPLQQMSAYLSLWICLAAVSLAATAGEMFWRCYRMQSQCQSRLTRLAAEQFLPCVLAGALLTAVLVSQARESLWMLPGLWSVLFSLGVFASARLLPRAVFWVGGWYLGAGILCLMWAQGEAAFSPWAMAGTFGVGQFLTAAILYVSLETQHESPPESSSAPQC